MAKKAAKGEYAPKNPAKYVGTLPITYRSSWELTMMMWLDKHPYILAWASESIQIPYFNPVKNAWSVYIPDFFVVYADGSGTGQKHCELVEIKPEKECFWHQGTDKNGRKRNVSEATQLVQAINYAKWQAAEIYCKKRAWKFRIVTEKQLFNYK